MYNVCGFIVLKVVHSPNLHKKSEQFNNSKLSEIVGGTTLHLFDETGMLRTRRLKLMVYPEVSGKPLNIFNTRKEEAHCGCRYQIQYLMIQNILTLI